MQYSEVTNTKDRHSIPIESWNKNVEKCIDYYREAHDSYKSNFKFIFDVSLTEEDIKNFEGLEAAAMSCNIIRPYMLNSLKNVRESIPTPYVKCDNESENDTAGRPVERSTIKQILSEELKRILKKNYYENVVYKVAKDAWAGSIGIFKLRTDYANNNDFQQEVIIEAVQDPTRVYFDPFAKKSTMQDGNYVFELRHMNKSQFESFFPDKSFDEVYEKAKTFKNSESWISEKKDTMEKVITVCDYFYLKEDGHKKIYKLKDGEIVDEKPKSKDDILSERTICEKRLYQCVFSGDTILKGPNTTNFRKLNYIRVPGETYFCEGKERTSSYAQHAFDAQRIKNFMLNFFLREALNNRSKKVYIAKGSVDEDGKKSLRNPTKMDVVEYNAYTDDDSSIQKLALPPPQSQPVEQLPTQYFEIFAGIDTTIDKILGQQFQSLAERDMSGKALYNLADYYSASNEVLMQNILLAIQRMGEVCVDAIEEIYETRNINVYSDKMSADTAKYTNSLLNGDFEFVFEREKYHVVIDRGVNFKLQQQASVEQMLKLSEVSPIFAQFLSTDGFKFLLNNIDLVNKDDISQSFSQFSMKMQQQQKMATQMQAQQAQAGGDQQIAQAKMMDSKARMLNAQANMEEAKIKAAQVQHEISSGKVDNVLDILKIGAEDKKTDVEAHVQMHRNHLNAGMRS